ncbi:class I SAM-dependent methyltransferase [Algimonas porphyrae]|uniref:Class I SAM-dependent methyltransferase n=1 Tax=Algimonas porphyrae TaxID=1128113 RepID=A0ABQ5UXQ8_9PROT|nr:class I SAM-dependent methyltransferase [Algimonas porphyrae]GLQ19996.1 hypothetical protein GCM10007854_09510 [Algimonas porphyrae]
MLPRSDFDRDFQTLIANHDAGARGYLQHHEQRFYELFDTLARYVGDRDAPKVLEIGTSPFTTLYKRLFPHVRLTTIDRPLSMGGAGTDFSTRDAQAEAHHNFDLNMEALPPSIGQFDYIVFSEILEHLVINPTQMIEELVALLKPDGYLYLTTPNFFSYHLLARMARRDNPQVVMHRRGEDPDAAYHFREYALNELVEAAIAAGGRVVLAETSACWETDEHRQQLAEFPYLYSNLILMVMPAASTQHEAITDPVMTGPFDPLKQDLLSFLAQREAEAIETREIDDLKARLERYETGRFAALVRWLSRRH